MFVTLLHLRSLLIRQAPCFSETHLVHRFGTSCYHPDIFVETPFRVTKHVNGSPEHETRAIINRFMTTMHNCANVVLGLVHYVRHIFSACLYPRPFSLQTCIAGAGIAVSIATCYGLNAGVRFPAHLYL